ncbi:hypothetical protein [Hufsiella ginkgonis]|uniref:Uncharacterized protein n=1 Tax=Hufsiella ginkgonis TaxID=2695274 RepID=A0A7K1XUR9_9SPHI|nr:hypothetical protein [Hufsiella ginkgonis]MXV14755.1 hypothetical protein [Hufsiella ginkgonis]
MWQFMMRSGDYKLMGKPADTGRTEFVHMIMKKRPKTANAIRKHAQAPASLPILLPAKRSAL